jgi:hypothetical protein
MVIIVQFFECLSITLLSLRDEDYKGLLHGSILS